MTRAGLGVRIGIGGVLLGALAAPAIAPSGAQAPAGEQELIDRIRQIQDGLGRQAAPPEEPAAPDRQALRQEGAALTPPGLGEDEVRSLMRTGLGVEVLEVELVESAGRPAYAVTVMHPAGNYDGAFQVEVLLVDRATGGLLGRVPQRPRVASDVAEPAGQAGFESGGPEIRRRSFR